jgi:hypothetical protein
MGVIRALPPGPSCLKQHEATILAERYIVIDQSRLGIRQRKRLNAARIEARQPDRCVPLRMIKQRKFTRSIAAADQ